MKTIFFVFFCLGLVSETSAQIDFSTDSTLLAIYCNENITYGKTGHKQHLHYHHKPVLKLILGFYKGVLSDQISANCEFMPSCSSFSWLALDEFGIIKALFLTADRLTRCNGNAQPETFPYLVSPEDAKIVDYPSQYKFTE